MLHDYTTNREILAHRSRSAQGAGPLHYDPLGRLRPGATRRANPFLGLAGDFLVVVGSEKLAVVFLLLPDQLNIFGLLARERGQGLQVGTPMQDPPRLGLSQ